MLAPGGTFTFGPREDRGPLEQLQAAITAALEIYLNGEPGLDHAVAQLEETPGGGLTIIVKGTTGAGRRAVRMLRQEAGLRPQGDAQELEG